EPVRTAHEIYMRLHGPAPWYRHDYSETVLKCWAGRIRASGTTSAWVYFNNDYASLASMKAADTCRLVDPGAASTSHPPMGRAGDWPRAIPANSGGLFLSRLADRDRGGRVAADGNLEVIGCPGVFALGDVAPCRGDGGHPLPGLAQLAKQQAIPLGKSP